MRKIWLSLCALFALALPALADSYCKSSGGVDCTYQVSGALSTSLDLGVSHGSGSNTIAWTTDGVNNFARISYNVSNTESIYWNFTDTTKTQVYVRWDSRFNASGKTAKHMKVFGNGYQFSQPFSNATFYCNPGQPCGILYDDSVGGGDTNSETLYSGILQGGSSLSRAPPNYVVTTPGFQNDTSWHTWEAFAKFSNSQVGEYVVWRDGTMLVHWTAMYNAGSGLEGRYQISFGDFSAQSGWTLDYKNVWISFDRPSLRIDGGGGGGSSPIELKRFNTSPQGTGTTKRHFMNHEKVNLWNADL